MKCFFLVVVISVIISPTIVNIPRLSPRPLERFETMLKRTAHLPSTSLKSRKIKNMPTETLLSGKINK